MAVRHAVILLIVLSGVVSLGPSRAGAQAPADSTVAPRRPMPEFPGPGTRAWQLGLTRPDRLQHLSLSLTIGLGAGLISHRPAAAAGASLGCGLAKELYDIPHTGFDVIDLLAGLIGGAAATAITAAVID